MSIKNNSAFTLVELAIVIVIIGLLVGGVLQGQALIRQSKLTNMIKMAESFKSAHMQFKDKYKCIAGDCPNAANFLPVTNGDGDGLIEISPIEYLVAWQSLGLANIIKGSYSGTGTYMIPGTNSPVVFDNVTANVMTTTNGNWQMYWTNTNGSYVNHMVFGAMDRTLNNQNWQPFLEASEAYSLDVKTDDGLPGKGLVRTHAYHASIARSNLCTDNNDANIATYQVGTSGANCEYINLLYF